MADAPRPAPVTYAATAVMLGGLSLVVTAFWQAGVLQSLDMRTEVERMLARQPSGFGFTVDGWLRVLKVLGMVCAACSVAAAILGWQALRRSHAARVGLLVVVGPLVLTGLALQPLFALLVAAGVLVLWLPAANAWFKPSPAGRMQPMSQAPTPPGPYDPYGRQTPPPYGAPPPSGPPVGSSPYGAPAPPPYPQSDPPSHPQAYPPVHPQTYPPAPLGPPSIGVPVDERRPGAVTAAAVITFVVAGLTALGGLLLAVVGHAQAARIHRALVDSGREMRGVTVHELAVGFVVLGVVLALAGLAAVVVAYFVLRRSAAARIVLTVLAAGSILLSLIAITSLVALVTLVGSIVTIVLLYRRASNAWFARRPLQPPYPGAPWSGPGNPWPGA